MKKGKATRSTGLVTRRGGGERRRRRGWRRWWQGPASLLCALGRAPDPCSGTSQPPPQGVSPALSSVPATPAPVAPGAQPQMSSHNSRLAADSYKNCVWTISGEAPELRAPVSCGVPLRSLKAPDHISGAARTSQTLGSRGPSRGKVDQQARGSRPCVGIPIAPGVCLVRLRPGVPRVARVGSLRRPRWGESPLSGLGNPGSPLPAPSLGSPGSPGIRKTGPRRGRVSEPKVLAAGLVGLPPPPSPAHAPARALSASLWLSRGRGAGGSSGGGGWDGGERWNAPPGHLQRPGSRAGSRRAGEVQG